VTGLSHAKETVADFHVQRTPPTLARPAPLPRKPLRLACTARRQGGGKRVITISRPFDGRVSTISPDRGVMPVSAVMLT